MNIRKSLIVLVLMLAGAAVFAGAIPDGSTLTLTQGGTVVGSGSYVGGNLNLVVLDTTATTGTATLSVTNQGGHTMTYTVDLTMTSSTDAAGTTTYTATMTVGGVPLDELNPSILARGGDVNITTTSGNLPAPGTVIHEPNDHANANATNKKDNSPDVPTTGATNAGDHSGQDSNTGGQPGSD